MSWMEALKEHNKQAGKWSVPKKGTPEYDAVKKLQDSMAGVAEKPKAEKKKPVKKTELNAEAPPKETKVVSKAEYIEEKVKPRIKALKKMQAEADVKAEMKKAVRAKYEIEEAVAKKAKNTVRPKAELVAEEAIVKSKVDARRAEVQAKKDAKKAKSEPVAVAVPDAPAPKTRKPRTKMTVEKAPVVLEFS